MRAGIHLVMRAAAGLALVLTTLAQAANLEFKETSKEVHAAPEATTVTADFEFTNRSGKPVDIRECKSSCTCVSVKIKDGKMHYAPGESGLIRAEFELGNFTGDVNKVVALWTEKDPEEKPSATLTIQTHIPVLVSLEPKTVKWDLNGKAEPQIVKIKTSHNKPINVTSVVCEPAGFKHELKTIEAGKSYELIVTPLGTGTPGLSRIVIGTDCGIRKYRSLQAFASVSQPLRPNAAAKR